jgi:hypothetical protein
MGWWSDTWEGVKDFGQNIVDLHTDPFGTYKDILGLDDGNKGKQGSQGQYTTPQGQAILQRQADDARKEAYRQNLINELRTNPQQMPGPQQNPMGNRPGFEVKPGENPFALAAKRVGFNDFADVPAPPPQMPIAPPSRAPVDNAINAGLGAAGNAIQGILGRNQAGQPMVNRGQQAQAQALRGGASSE